MTEELTNFDPADYLETDADRALYLSEALETNDDTYIVQVLGTIARSIDKVNSSATRNHRTEFETLREQATPSLETVLSVIKALGLKLTALPI